MTEEGAEAIMQASMNEGLELTLTRIRVPDSILEQGYPFVDVGLNGAGASIHFVDDVLPQLYRSSGAPDILDASWVPLLIP